MHCLCLCVTCYYPPPVSIPPPQGGNRHLAHEQQEINRKSQAPKALKKIFGWVILELAGREWCTVPPPQGGNRHLVTVPPGSGGNRRPLGGDGHGGGMVGKFPSAMKYVWLSCSLRILHMTMILGWTCKIGMVWFGFHHLGGKG